MTQLDIVCDLNRRLRARCEAAERHRKQWKRLAKVLRSRERWWVKQARVIMLASEEMKPEREPELRRGDYARMKFWREKAEEAEARIKQLEHMLSMTEGGQ